MKKLLVMSLATFGLEYSIIAGGDKRKVEETDVSSKKVKLNTPRKGYRYVDVDYKVYEIEEKDLKNSQTLKDIMSDVSDSDIIPLPNITKKVWEQVIIPTLKEGREYKLSEKYAPEELVAIIQAADYLNIEYLYAAALQKSVEYIQENIDLFDKNPQVFDVFKDLSAHVLEFITSQINTRYMMREDRTFTGHTGWVNSVAFSPDGMRLASGSGDKTITLWDVKTGQKIRTFTGHTGWVNSVTFNPDGMQLASGSEDGTIILWDVKTGNQIRMFIGHQGWVHSVAFSPDGMHLASGSGDKTITLWEVKTGQKIRTFIGHTDLVNSIVFSSDGTVLASGSGDGTVILWDVKTGQKIRTFIGHTNSVNSVAFSPGGTVLVSGSGDGTIILWDIKTAHQIQTFIGHQGWIFSVVVSPDGMHLASGSEDGTITLWDVKTGKEIRTFTGRTNTIWSVVFSSNGKWLASGSLDGTVKLWSIFDFDFDFDQALFICYALKHKQIDKNSKVYETFTDEQKKMLQEFFKK